MAKQHQIPQGVGRALERRVARPAQGGDQLRSEPGLAADQRTAMRLQRLVGNQAVTQLLGRRGADGPLFGGAGVAPTTAAARIQRSPLSWAPKVQTGQGIPAVQRMLAVQRDVKLVRHNNPPFRDVLGPNDWGMTDTEQVIPNIAAEQREPGTKAGPGNVPPAVLPLWGPKVGSVTGKYSLRQHLLAGVTEVGGPGKDTTKGNWQHQVANLNALGEDTPGFPCQWYMVKAVGAHELVHKGSVGTALEETEGAITRKIEGDIPAVRAATPRAALTAFKANPAYKAANDAAREIWDLKYVSKIDSDHTGMTPEAEHKVVDPMIEKIRKVRDPDYKA
jgi:hypothetical protein